MSERTYIPEDFFEEGFDDAEVEPSSVANVDDFIKRKGKKRKKSDDEGPSISNSDWKRCIGETERMMGTADWTRAVPRHFVALYAILHHSVYGIMAAELTPKIRAFAAGTADRMLYTHFGGNQGEFAQMMRWVWMREKDREEWRRAQKKPGGRVGWKLMFGGALLTDWRVEKLRMGSRS